MNPTAGIIVIGNEILSGRTQDINIAYLAKRLAELGIQLKEARIIPDRTSTIVKVINEVRATYDYVFTTGGIGPTHDDITSESIAEAFGVINTIHPETYQLLESYYGRDRFNQARQRMAHLPLGATPIENLVSKAPGYFIGNVYVMAGVPQIMQAMFEIVAPTLRHGQTIISRSWHAYNASEGKIAKELEGIQKRFPQTDIGSYPFALKNNIGVTIVIKGSDVPAVEQASMEVHSLFKEAGFSPIAGEAK